MSAPVLHASFTELGLPPLVVKALARLRITTPTPVQSAVIPDALAGRDVLGRAATGSGKTLAFGLPILSLLSTGHSRPKSPRALIIVPTRELAGQVRSSLEPMADAIGMRIATVYGGTPYDRQIKRLRAGVDVVVATPGRLSDLISRGACRLDQVEITVLDEADHLCDLGFFPAVSELVAMTPEGGQRMLLSATLDGDVDRLVRKHMSRPVTHDCDPDSDKPDMEHHVLVTGPHNKLESTASLLRANPRSIVFTRTRIGATNLAENLANLGVTTVDLHGSLSQNARERNLRKFRSGQADVVVATDVAARGIHVDGVSLVVHYDAPTEQKAYLHRSGRTARAGKSGSVVTMTTARQVASVVRLQKAVGVVALHHDARTSPQPMTAESLALTGLSAADAGVDLTGKSASSTTYNGSRQRSGGGARQGAGARPSTGRSSYKGSPSQGGRFRGGDSHELSPSSRDDGDRRSEKPSYPRVDRFRNDDLRARPSRNRDDRIGRSGRPDRESSRPLKSSEPAVSVGTHRGAATTSGRQTRAITVPGAADTAGSRARTERPRTEKPRRSPSPDPRPSSGKPTRKPGAGSGLKKARWTGSEKRARAKR